MLRDLILNASDLPRQAINVAEWGCTVYVRTLTGTERDAFDSETAKLGEEGKALFRARMAAATLCDENGEPVFTAEDAEALGRKSGKVLDRLWDVAAKLNGFGQSVEDDRKN